MNNKSGRQPKHWMKLRVENCAQNCQKKFYYFHYLCHIKSPLRAANVAVKSELHGHLEICNVPTSALCGRNTWGSTLRNAPCYILATKKRHPGNISKPITLPTCWADRLNVDDSNVSTSNLQLLPQAETCSSPGRNASSGLSVALRPFRDLNVFKHHLSFSIWNQTG